MGGVPQYFVRLSRQIRFIYTPEQKDVRVKCQQCTPQLAFEEKHLIAESKTLINGPFLTKKIVSVAADYKEVPVRNTT